jgi:flagellar basal-body rod protein FlgG
MERGLYIAASGMLAEQVRQDQIANDLANASTPGYKADTSVQSSFGQVLLSNTATGQVVGPMSLGVHISQEVTDLTQGPLQQTGNPLDFALDGSGFFTVQTANGVAYTRDGQFEVNGSGQLINDTGNPVLGTDGKPINVGNAKNLSVSPDGVVTSNGKVAGTLNIVSLTNPAKQGDTLWSGTPGATPAATTVDQGYLEGSGVQPAQAMVDMIVSLRAYESSQRVLQGIDETLGKAVTSVGSATGS